MLGSILVLVLITTAQEEPVSATHTNHLIHETSPYLRQHAHNPVDWYPWGKEALEKSRKEDKPIFLSIGYAACHWCHVMERECFENEAIAAVMNENFINIKVDREERPDLDEIYMSAVQLMTGSGGWPMSVFLTPDLKPFYGGTYFPPEDRFGRPGFPNLVKALARAYRERRAEVDSTSDEIVKRVRDMGVGAAGEKLPDASALTTAVDQLERTFDHQYGGFGDAPKFPHSMDIMLLLRAAQRQLKVASSTAWPLEMAELTLKAMARGGMYDQIGGGFHRYSTDERWLVPHFEKMLYDNALLARTYTEAFQLARDPFYERVVRETLDYVLREMQDPAGGFYSTQDADSEGEEGKFFVWTQDEILSQLGEQDDKLFCAYYAVTPGGNFEHANILSAPRVLDDVARELGRPVDACATALASAKEKLYQVREKRVHPPRDEKILTSWNGLMIGALARASLAFEEPRYLRAARDAARFVMASLRTKEGRYLRTFKDGQAKLNAYLDDHAYLMQGLVDLYQATFDASYLEEAQRIEALLAQHFFDAKEGGFFFTSDDHEALIHRSKDPYDGATPSGNSVALLAMLELYELTGDDKILGRVEQTLKLYAAALASSPRAFPYMLIALDFYLGPRQTLVLLDGGGDRAPLQRVATSSFFPRLVLAGATTPIADGKTPLDGKPTAYLCESFTCKAPTTDPAALASTLRK